MFREKVVTILENALDVSLGAPLWAIELELPTEARRPWKFTRAARLVGSLYARGWKPLPDMPEEAEAPTAQDALAHVCDASCDHGDPPQPIRARCLTLTLREEGHDLRGSQPQCVPCNALVCSYMGPVCGCNAHDCVDHANAP